MKNHAKPGKALLLSLLCALNLAHAAESNNKEQALMAPLGLGHGAESIDTVQAFAAYQAADASDMAKLQTLVGHPPDQKLMSFLLYQSIIGDDFKVFTTLLDAGADAAYHEHKAGHPAIHHAASSAARTPRYLQELLRRGVDVDARNTLGETPLHSALGLTEEPYEQIKKVETLLAAGADIHARDKYGKTVLFKATIGHNPQRDWVMYFLEKGVDPRATSDLGYTFQFGYLYGGNTDSGLLEPDAKRYREKARQWLIARSIPLETRTIPKSPVERLGDTFITALPSMESDITLDAQALQAFRLGNAEAAAVMRAIHKLPGFNPTSNRIHQVADALAASFPQDLQEVASLFYYDQYIAHHNDRSNVHTLAGALALYTAGNLAAARGAYPDDDAFNRQYYGAALQLDRYLTAHPPALSGEALKTAYLRLIMLGLHNAIAANLARADEMPMVIASGERNLHALYGIPAQQLDIDARGITLSK